MGDLITCQDAATVMSAASPNDVGFSLQATLLNGPPPGKVWIVDAASAILADPTGDVLGGYAPGESGIFVVPITAPSAQVTDGLDFINPLARGLQIGGQIVSIIGGTTLPSAFTGMYPLTGPVIIPNGYTLTAIWYNSGDAFDAGTILTLYAAIRTLKSGD
jgi:hypothetical protein